MDSNESQDIDVEMTPAQNAQANNIDLTVLMDDNKKLQAQVDKLQIYLLELQKSKLKQPQLFRSKKINHINKQIASLGDIPITHKRVHLEQQLSHYLRYVGMVVKKRSPSECVIMYDISIEGQSVALFVIKMEKYKESDQWYLKSYHLPIGFDLDYIKEKYAPMTIEYVTSIHKALTSQYNRLWQINQLKEILPSYANLQHSSNGCHIELNVKIRAQNYPESVMSVCFNLLYDPLEIRPSDIKITKLGISDSLNMRSLKEQLKEFKMLRLQDAFMLSLRNEQKVYICLLDEDLMFYNREMLYEDNPRNNIDNIATTHFDSSDEEVVYSRNGFGERNNHKTASRPAKNMDSKKSHSADKKRASLEDKRKYQDSDTNSEDGSESDTSSDSVRENKKGKSLKSTGKKNVSPKVVKSKSKNKKKEIEGKKTSRRNIKKPKEKRERALKVLNNSTLSASSLNSSLNSTKENLKIKKKKGKSSPKAVTKQKKSEKIKTNK